MILRPSDKNKLICGYHQSCVNVTTGHPGINVTSLKVAHEFDLLTPTWNCCWQSQFHVGVMSDRCHVGVVSDQINVTISQV